MKEICKFSLTKKYRYVLTRYWGSGSNICVFILCNPTQDANLYNNDKTISNCINLAKHNKYDGIIILNLFTYINKNVEKMKGKIFPNGIFSNFYIMRYTKKHKDIIVAWGDNGKHRNRDQKVLKLLKNKSLLCIGKTLSGCPLHPSRKSTSISFQAY